MGGALCFQPRLPLRPGGGLEGVWTGLNSKQPRISGALAAMLFLVLYGQLDSGLFICHTLLYGRFPDRSQVETDSLPNRFLRRNFSVNMVTSLPFTLTRWVDALPLTHSGYYFGRKLWYQLLEIIRNDIEGAMHMGHQPGAAGILGVANAYPVQNAGSAQSYPMQAECQPETTANAVPATVQIMEAVPVAQPARAATVQPYVGSGR
eukprot:1394566-Amorphochlora_amoeboformis.AAC.1